MKQKIKAALQQGHKDLGITDDEVFERVASAAETFITDEAKIPEFVTKAESMLKLYQSEADKARTAKKRISELEAKLGENNQQNQTPPAALDADSIKAIVSEALAASTAANETLINSLKEKITSFETAQTAKESISAARTEYRNNDYVKGYPDEANDAWERAMEINTERGGTMTSKELLEKAMGYFGKAVARRGGDITKPFEGTDNDKPNTDFTGQAAMLKEMGVDLGD